MDNSKGKNEGFLKILSVAILSSLITGLLLFNVAPIVFEQERAPSRVPDIGGGIPPQRIGIEDSVTEGEGTIVSEVAKRVMPTVVGIATVTLQKRSTFDPNPVERTGIGSGVIVHQDGYIITNHHVVGSNPEKILVTLFNGDILEGETKWSDPTLDMAVVKIEGPPFPYAVMGDADRLEVGEIAIAIGNPLGLMFQRTVTSGIVSALNRTITLPGQDGEVFMEDLIQTDASINPGNSGGPLLNSRGEIVGINTVKVASAEGMGFAIPINIARSIIRKFDEDGKFTAPYLGIFAYDREIARFLTQDLEIDRGVYVAKIDKRGPAYRVGVRLDDVITHVDGREVNTMMQLRCLIYEKDIGETVSLRVQTNGKTRNVDVKLAKY